MSSGGTSSSELNFNGSTTPDDMDELGSSYDSTQEYYVEQAESFIGGSAVISRTSTKPRTGSRHSLYEDTEDDQDNDDFVIPATNFPKDRISEPLSSHKIFTFSLPFGGKNLLPTSPLSSLRAFLSNDQISDDNKSESTDESKDHLTRHDIKLKLRRQESITSIEERYLFANNKKMQNVRAKAVKNALMPDMLINAVKNLSTTNTNTVTTDGFENGRLDSIWDELDGDFVILGGYRGSILRNTQTKKRVWIPIKAGFNMTKIDLLLGPKRQDELDAQKSITADGMLTHLGPIDVSKKLIKKLAINPKVHIEDFGYDWRLSLDITSDQLKQRLKKLYDAQRNKRGVFIIAHSMGGLLAHKVLQEYTHLVRGIIYVGAPSQCPNILGPLRFGDEVILNKTILNSETNFFMRSSFYFLPIDGRCFVNKNNFKRYDLDYFDPDVWVEYGLSPLVSEERKREKVTSEEDTKDSKYSLFAPVKMIKSTSSMLKEENDADYKTSFKESYDYLKETLIRTKAFMDSLEYCPSKDYPPLVMIYGDKVPTVRGAKVNNITDIKQGLYQDFYYGPGDGVVHHKWLLPEKRGFPVVAKIVSNMAHVSLMTDLEAFAKAFVSILDAEKALKC